jgi:hypothetical protein
MSAALLAALLPFAARADGEPPPNIQALAKNTSYLVCTTITMSGLFSNVSNGKKVETTVDQRMFCGSAFQISRNEILTVAHTVPQVQDGLRRHLTELLEIFRKNGTVHRPVPSKIERVKSVIRLVGPEGIEYESETLHYRGTWKGALLRERIESFLDSLMLERRESPPISYRIRNITKDTGRDLARIPITPDAERREYVSLAPSQARLGDKVWNASVHSRKWHSDAAGYALVISGFLYKENQRVHTFPWMTARLNLVRTPYPTRHGQSGGFSVADDGRLIGVTHAARMDELAWSQDRPHPCDDFRPCMRYDISESEIRAFLDAHASATVAGEAASNRK